MPDDPTPRRPFRLLDAMILVAATALGIEAVRYRLPGFVTRTVAAGHQRTTIVPPGATGLGWVPAHLVGCVAAGLATASPALLLSALFRPREPLRLRLQQPGVLAMVVATLMTALHLGRLLALAARDGWPSSFIAFGDGSVRWDRVTDHFPGLAFDPLPGRVGWLIGLAWVLLWLTGRWRRPVDWVDRSGRVVGVLWMVAQGIAMLP